MPGIISTSGINGAGLKKWSPRNRWGNLHAAAMLVIESEDVLLAKMHPLSTTDSISENNFCLMDTFSTIASMINPADFNSFNGLFRKINV